MECENYAINKITEVLSKLLATGKTEDMNKAIQDREYLKKADGWMAEIETL